MATHPIQYAPWTSDIELAFYSALATLKINHDRLDSSARKVLGLYELNHKDSPERSSRMQIHASALTSDEYVSIRSRRGGRRQTYTISSSPQSFYRAEGLIRNFNTAEEFRNVDKASHIERAGKTIFDAIKDGTIFSCPSLLCSFSAICYADLKKYRFTYHFAYPCLHSDPQWRLLVSEGKDVLDGVRKLGKMETETLVSTVQTWRYSVDTRQHGFFLAKRVRKEVLEAQWKQGGGGGEIEEEKDDDGNMNFAAQKRRKSRTQSLGELGFLWVVASLSSYENGFFNNTKEEDRFVCFADPSTYPGNPGWMLRNLLVLVRQRWHLDKVQVLFTGWERDERNKLISRTVDSTPPNVPDLPKVTGWERDERNKLISRTVDLAAFMDPAKLADQAVDLNLKLIKWRISPSINLDTIKHTSCLLLGAGTLGSYVARGLMGWGVRKITFVDNARVSYSNPVRQPLYDFKDCEDGGVRKAERAADVLNEIYPGMNANGACMSVPMAGHAMVDEEKTKKEFERLKGLIESHDAIFLLMDSRESRWLPTVMGKAAGKIVINAALGFDTYVVMRHGLRKRKPITKNMGGSDGAVVGHADGVPKPMREAASDVLEMRPAASRTGKQESSKAVGTDAADNSKARHPATDEGEELGCYFCSDVVAPADSQKNATLDQQCTVTRPGAALLASSLAVELLVSITQHALGARAPAPIPPTSGSVNQILPAPPTDPSLPGAHPLGTVPHQLRGYMSTWQTIQVKGSAYDCCAACSPKILEAYEEGGWAFVKRALVEKGYVEEISGLAEVQRRGEEAEAEMEEWSEGEEEGEGEMI
ncbi:Autophagy protein 7 [Friedmanniomyces endolithicus]|nr:Autophagy protein 7 [Friedmanniomyces endolithicus]